ncbi:hypothetical protein BJX99DRAFT_109239 [Aspergillus californicus]
MSAFAPTGQFGGLSLHGDSDRSDSEIASPRETESELESESETMSDDSVNLSAVRASSGLAYDLANSKLDFMTNARALVGLTTDFKMLFCGWSSLKGGPCCEFIIVERVRVHIFLGKVVEGNRCSCSCAVSQGLPDVACPHIFWLLDRLRQVLIITPLPSKLLLESSGHAYKVPIEELLDSPEALEKTAEKLKWLYIRSPFEGGMSKAQRARDILSAFSAHILPEEFRQDLFESGLTRRTPEQCVVQGDIEATTFKLTVHDDYVYASLCQAMPPGACAAIYFDKILERSRKLLTSFDSYCQVYKAGETSPTVNVSDILEQLKKIVKNMQLNIKLREPNGREGAAKALIALLEDISNRNRDALDLNIYRQKSFNGEEEDERNLYQQLIGKTEETGGFFILDVLEHLPAKDLHPFGDKLRGILDKIEVARAPKEYILNLQSLVRAAQAAATTETSTSGLGLKRSAEEDGEGDVKRPRLPLVYLLS